MIFNEISLRLFHKWRLLENCLDPSIFPLIIYPESTGSRCLIKLHDKCSEFSGKCFLKKNICNIVTRVRASDSDGPSPCPNMSQIIWSSNFKVPDRFSKNFFCNRFLRLCRMCSARKQKYSEISKNYLTIPYVVKNSCKHEKRKLK